jgi:2-hydroxyglutarate dehydrogenase
LILATDVGQVSYLDGLVKNATAIEKETGRLIPLQRISGDEARSLEPDLGDGVMAALLSPETGIVDSHALMESMQSTVEDSEMGEMVFGTSVVRIDAVEARGDRGGAGWVVQTVTRDKDGVEGERSSVLAGIIVNAAGLKWVHFLTSLGRRTDEGLTQCTSYDQSGAARVDTASTVFRQRILLQLYVPSSPTYGSS